jgi:hypothetical protein
MIEMIKILRQLILDGDEARARQALADLKQDGNTVLVQWQIDNIIANPQKWLTENENQAAENEVDIGLGVLGPPRSPMQEREERVAAGESLGRRGVFENVLERAFAAAGITPTGATRTALGTGLAPLSTEFDLRGGLGELGTDPLFQEFIPNRMRPDASTLRGLLQQAAGLFAPGAIEGQRMPGEPEGMITEAQRARWNTQEGFLEKMGEDAQTMQFNLALGTALQSVPRHLRTAFQKFAQRQFRRFIMENPNRQFLPSFVEAGYNWRLPSRPSAMPAILPQMGLGPTDQTFNPGMWGENPAVGWSENPVRALG